MLISTLGIGIREGFARGVFNVDGEPTYTSPTRSVQSENSEGVGSRRFTSDRQSMDGSRGRASSESGSTAVELVSDATPASDDLLETILDSDRVPLAYWESPNGIRVAGLGCACATTQSSFDAIERRADNIFDRIHYDGPTLARPRMIGGRSFLASDPQSPWSAFPAGYFVLPRHLVVTDGSETYHTVTAPRDAVDDTRDELNLDQLAHRTQSLSVEWTSPEPSRDVWTASVEQLRSRIADGGIKKAVLAHSLALTLDRTPDARECIHRLRELNAGCFINLFQPQPDTTFLAATPERLVTLDGSSMNTAALAGSMRRGASEADDDRLSDALLSDGKESHEHALVVESIESDLSALGARVSIDARRVKRFRSVQHLYTPIHATHDEPPHVLRVVDQLHPTPAVGGIPRSEALRVIDQTESFDRGWYASPFGWFDANGNGSFAVGIRSGLLTGDGGHLFAGAGIVEESEPDEEWEEVQWKYRPMLDALNDS